MAYHPYLTHTELLNLPPRTVRAMGDAIRRQREAERDAHRRLSRKGRNNP